MSKFPTTEAEIVSLADTMAAGYTEHPEDFPSVTVTSLKSLLTSYKQLKDALVELVESESQTKIAVVQKKNILDGLVEMMKMDLKLSEADTISDSYKLAEIGWGPKAGPQPLEAPGTATNLHPTAEGQGMIWLSWDKPAAGTGGAVWSYIVERRQQAQGGEFGPWALASNSYNCEINLTGQPVDVRVEYRVKASNAAGESMPSNSVSVVLP